MNDITIEAYDSPLMIAAKERAMQLQAGEKKKPSGRKKFQPDPGLEYIGDDGQVHRTRSFKDFWETL